jgi:hypothetical protein
MAIKSAAAAATDCTSRQRTKLPAFPEVYTDQTIFLFEDDSLAVEFTLNQRNVLQPGFISPLCPGNADGVVVVADRCKNVKNAVVTYPNANPNAVKINITFNLADPKKRTFTLFTRTKFEEDKGRTGKDKPRKLALETFPLGLPVVGKSMKTNSNEIPEE